MKNTKSLLGFTLIELLVVITIIGILATGAVSVFTSQIQKARDSTRVTDIKAVQSGVEQFYQDAGEYPDKGGSFSGVTVYVPKLPSDPKTENASGNSVFDYMYNVAADGNTIPNQVYEISTHFEQNGSITGKAATDGGDDDYRLELGIDIENIASVVALAAGVTASAADYACITPTGTVAGNCTTADNPMMIR